MLHIQVMFMVREAFDRGWQLQLSAMLPELTEFCWLPRQLTAPQAPFFRNDLKSHLYPLPQASASYIGKDTWEIGNNIAEDFNDVGTTTHIMNLRLQDIENAPFSLQYFRVQALQ